MNLKLLLDGIVRQTTVLIAQLSTTSGARAPLGHVADQVFIELAREIENQGVGRQIVADMFGMALRSYQKKMHRLSASATEQQQTLWEAVFRLVEAEQPSRARVFQRFAHDGQREVAAVLADLVRSGLIYMTGTGDSAQYGVTTDAMREKVQQASDQDALANVVWLHVFRAGRVTRSELAGAMNVGAPALDEAVADLINSGRLVETEGVLTSSNFVVPLGTEQGWEAAILHHFCTVAVAIAAKVRSGATGSAPDDRIGGSTFTFQVGPGHPLEARVYGLLARVRSEVQALWDEVSRHNSEQSSAPEGSVKVSFYLGQTIEDGE